MQTFKVGDRVKVIADLPYTGCDQPYYGEGRDVGEEGEVTDVSSWLVHLHQGDQFFGHFYPAELVLLSEKEPEPEPEPEPIEKPLFEGEFWFTPFFKNEFESGGSLYTSDTGLSNAIRVRVKEIRESEPLQVGDRVRIVRKVAKPNWDYWDVEMDETIGREDVIRLIDGMGDCALTFHDWYYPQASLEKIEE